MNHTTDDNEGIQDTADTVQYRGIHPKEKMGLRKKVLIKSELIQLLAQKQSQLNFKDVDLAVKTVIEQMTIALARGKRIELRGFGSFSLHKRPERRGRNPMTGEAVHLPVSYVPHFKPGKMLRARVDIPENDRIHKNKNSVVKPDDNQSD